MGACVVRRKIGRLAAPVKAWQARRSCERSTAASFRSRRPLKRSCCASGGIGIDLNREVKMTSRRVFWALGLALGPSAALAQTTVVQTYSLVDFHLVGPDLQKTVDTVDMSVNLECDGLKDPGCVAVKGVDPPGVAKLVGYEFETCDTSSTGSSNISIMTCASAGASCFFVANTSTGVAETPGCVVITGPVEVAVVHPRTTQVVLLHSDTDQSAATKGLAVRLLWRLPH